MSWIKFIFHFIYNDVKIACNVNWKFYGQNWFELAHNSPELSPLRLLFRGYSEESSLRERISNAVRNQGKQWRILQDYQHCRLQASVWKQTCESTHYSTMVIINMWFITSCKTNFQNTGYSTPCICIFPSNLDKKQKVTSYSFIWYVNQRSKASIS